MGEDKLEPECERDVAERERGRENFLIPSLKNLNTERDRSHFR